MTSRMPWAGSDARPPLVRLGRRGRGRVRRAGVPRGPGCGAAGSARGARRARRGPPVGRARRTPRSSSVTSGTPRSAIVSWRRHWSTTVGSTAWSTPPAWWRSGRWPTPTTRCSRSSSSPTSSGPCGSSAGSRRPWRSRAASWCRSVRSSPSSRFRGWSRTPPARPPSPRPTTPSPVSCGAPVSTSSTSGPAHGDRTGRTCPLGDGPGDATGARPGRGRRHGARRGRGGAGGARLHRLRMSAVDLPGLRAFLVAHAVPGLDEVEVRGDGSSRHRRLVGTAAGGATCSPSRCRPARSARRRSTRTAPSDAVAAVTAAGRRWLGLDLDPAPGVAALRDDPVLGPMVRARPHLRVPGSTDAFETAVLVVLGQHVSLGAGRAFAARLVAAYGDTARVACRDGCPGDHLGTRLGELRAFPAPMSSRHSTRWPCSGSRHHRCPGRDRRRLRPRRRRRNPAPGPHS